MASARTGSKPKDVHERALGLLAVRARSRRELERRLVQAGFDPDEEVGPELERLERVGLIDDEAFATADTVLDEAATDEEARALDLATARAARLADLPRERAYQRLSSLLMRRGYAPEVARGATIRALDLQAED